MKSESPKNILNLKLRGKSRWEQLVTKNVTQGEGRTWQKLRRSSSRREVDAVAWLLAIKWKYGGGDEAMFKLWYQNSEHFITHSSQERTLFPFAPTRKLIGLFLS